MDEKPTKLKLPEELYEDMLMFFRRTSLPRIQRERHEGKLKQQKIQDTNNTPSENKR